MINFRIPPGAAARELADKLGPIDGTAWRKCFRDLGVEIRVAQSVANSATEPVAIRQLSERSDHAEAVREALVEIYEREWETIEANAAGVSCLPPVTGPGLAGFDRKAVARRFERMVNDVRACSPKTPTAAQAQLNAMLPIFVLGIVGERLQEAEQKIAELSARMDK